MLSPPATAYLIECESCQRVLPAHYSSLPACPHCGSIYGRTVEQSALRSDPLLELLKGP